MSLDLLLLGDLGESDRAGAHRHLDACAECRDRFETMQRAAELFDREVLPRTRPGLVASAAADAPSVRAPARAGRRVAWGLGSAALVAAAAAVLLVALPGRDPKDSRGDLLATVSYTHL